MLLAQATFILTLVFMREISHLLTIFSKSSEKFDVLPFHGMLQFEKLKLSLSNATDELKTGKVNHEMKHHITRHSNCGKISKTVLKHC